MKQLVIFDLDGTLINSIKDLGAATNFALEKNGFPTHPLEAYPMYVGNGVSKLIERALPEDQRNEAMIKKIRADFTTGSRHASEPYTLPDKKRTNHHPPQSRFFRTAPYCGH